MKLARVIRTGGSWTICKPSLIVDKPPVGTIVQYERGSRNLYSVYFPGVHGCASMPGSMFSTYFEDLDDETG